MATYVPGFDADAFEEYWYMQLPTVMWHRAFGLEETLFVKTFEYYEVDKDYLEICDVAATYRNTKHRHVGKVR